MATAPPSTFMDKVVVRLPDGMRAALAAAAKANCRSQNAEIVHRLARSLQPEPSAQGA